MGAISNRMPPVTVVYDCGKRRAEKTFTDPYEARRFYMLKLKLNKNPELRKVD